MKPRELAEHLRGALGVQSKREIQAAARNLPRAVEGSWGRTPVRLGDDCAAIPDGEGFLLFAAEGMLPSFVAEEPRFAGYCAVMVNVSDVYAMGGRPVAVVDALFATNEHASEPVWQGMRDASAKLGVPIVGGHTNLHSPHQGLAVAIVGRAKRLLTSFDARPGDDLIAAIDLRGSMHPAGAFWNASTEASSHRLRAGYEILPTIAEQGWACAAKDISMGGLVGTAIMLLESSGVGASLRVDAVPRPAHVPLPAWLLAFPSFGFLLSVPPARRESILKLFAARDLAAAVVGQVDDGRQLTIGDGTEIEVVWDLRKQALTGFGDGDG